MQAMVLTKPERIEKHPLQLKDVPLPEIGLKDILVRVQACGICHTDLHTVEGELPLPKLPLIPGHQIVGIVEKKGTEVRRFNLGDRVGIAWLNSTCGRCEFCQSGRENLCEQAKFTGYHSDGGYAEYTAISENFAYAVPETFSPTEAAPLLCAGIIGYRALHLSEIKPGQRLCLYGFGASAHIVIQIALFWKCEVYVFTRSEKHQKLALDLGAAWAGKSEQIPEKKLHSSIIFAPAGELVPYALKALNRGGTLALAGIYMTPIPQLDYMEHLYYEKTLRSVANSTRKDGKQLLKLASEIPIRTQVTIFPLKEANRALQLQKLNLFSPRGTLSLALAGKLADQDVHHLIPVFPGHLEDLHIFSFFNPLHEWMVPVHDCSQDRIRGIQTFQDQVLKSSGEKLHLADLIDDYDAASSQAPFQFSGDDLLKTGYCNAIIPHPVL